MYMTLEQAVQYYYEMAEEEPCYVPAERYLQLAQWLEELKKLREKQVEGGIH